MNHVMPFEDSESHEISDGCSCHPTEIDGVMVHNAWDCREARERIGIPGKPWGVFAEDSTCPPPPKRA